MSERKTVLAVLDAALEAQRELSAWASRAGEYSSHKAKEALAEYQSIVQLAQDLSKRGQGFAHI